jgi:phosphoribosylanthranilate isomerase
VLRVGVFADLPRGGRAHRVRGGARRRPAARRGDAGAGGGLQRRAIKAVAVDDAFTAADALRFEGQASGILLDTRATPGGITGGTGRTFDWSRAREVRERASFLVLAGGLTPENVGVALTAVRPDAVDVSSGVESAPGRKDADKVRAFIQAVRNSR